MRTSDEIELLGVGRGGVHVSTYLMVANASASLSKSGFHGTVAIY